MKRPTKKQILRTLGAGMIGGGIGALVQSYREEIGTALKNATNDMKFDGTTVNTWPDRDWETE